MVSTVLSSNKRVEFRAADKTTRKDTEMQHWTTTKQMAAEDRRHTCRQTQNKGAKKI